MLPLARQAGQVLQPVSGPATTDKIGPAEIPPEFPTLHGILLDESHYRAAAEQADEWRELLTGRMSEFVAEQEFDVVFTVDPDYP